MSTFDLSSDSDKDSPKVKTGAVSTANRVAGAKPAAPKIAAPKSASAPIETPPAGNPETVEFYLGESANSFMPNLKDFKSVALMLGSLLVVALVVGFMLRTQGNATAPEALPISAASVQPTGLVSTITTATGASDPAKTPADAKTEDTVKNPSPPSALSSHRVSAVAAARVVVPDSASDLSRSTRLNEPARLAPTAPVAVQPAPAVQPQQQPVAMQPAPQQRPVFRPAAPTFSSGNSGGRISVGSGSTSVRSDDE